MVAKTFKSAAEFKASFEARLRTRANQTGVPFKTLQIKFVMERLVARLFRDPDAPWLLKGGFAMDLRYRPKARTTKDVDLSVSPISVNGTSELRNLLQDAAAIELGDFLTFRIGEFKAELTNAPKGGGRFPCEAVLLGKTYAKFHIDVGVGDALIGEPEVLVGDDFLGYAGIDSASARAIPKPQQFAEKVHAYTYPWEGRANTRTKDLVDLVLLIERGALDPSHIRAALRATFDTRGTHPLPSALSVPPPHWEAEFPTMAEEAGLSTAKYLAAFATLNAFWDANRLGEI